jgi:membrane protein DedA with SNARE-associated domain
MTDFIIGLIPDYGLIVLFFVVSLACMAVPLPSSMLVLTSGAFAATGDLNVWAVCGVAFTAYVLGDQVAFMIASRIGPQLLGWIRGKPRLLPIIERSEHLLKTKGPSAVFLSHTILSPTCPYISYLSGAGGMKWRVFSIVASVGAGVWVAVYVALGYLFASQLGQVASMLSQFFGVVIALCVVAGCIMLLRRHWQQHLLNGKKGT